MTISQKLNVGSRVPYRGGGTGIPPTQPQFSPSRNLEIEYYCLAINTSYLILHVTERKYVSSKCCLESLSQITSEAIWEDLNSKFSWRGGACPQNPLVGTHTHACVSVLSHTTITWLPLCPPSPTPNSKSCMKPWVASWVPRWLPGVKTAQVEAHMTTYFLFITAAMDWPSIAGCSCV